MLKLKKKFWKKFVITPYKPHLDNSGGVFIFGDMEHNDEIQRLEGEIFELRDELRRTIDREVIYKEILSEINNSVNEVISRDEENIRFKFDEVVDFKGFVHNMKDVILEYRRIYRNIDF